MRFILFLSLSITLLSCSDNDVKITECSKKCDRIVRNYCQRLRNENIRICGTGGGLNRDNTKINLIELSLATNEFQDIDSARKLVVNETESLLSFLNEQEDFRDCMIEYPYPAKNIKLFILCDVPEKNYENYIRAVGVGYNKVEYFYRDDSRFLNDITLFHEETYEEAKQILAAQEQK